MKLSHLDDDLLCRLLHLTLTCVERPYPNKPGHVIASRGDVRDHREVTPAFFGCFDWHSAVHGHWTLVRSLRATHLPTAASARRILNAHLTDERLGAELSFFERPDNRHFERPYGWAWLLLLHAETASFDDPDAKRWSLALQPLATTLARRCGEYLEQLPVPIRSGTHSNTAFAMVLAFDSARMTGDDTLAGVVERRARAFYGADRNVPIAWEPSGEDFLSPALAESDLMRRVLPAEELVGWFQGFIAEPERQLDLEPVLPEDLSDPRLGHLVGLCLHRVWCLEGLASLPGLESLSDLMRRVARRHAAAALEKLFETGYGGAHWLNSFLFYLLTERWRFDHLPRTT